MEKFLGGAIAMRFVIAGLPFLRFWKETRDPLFTAYALAFFVLAGNLVLLTIIGQGRECATSLYLVRLLAFVIILIAIVDKNLRKYYESSL